jgi:hypothetical protein
MVKRLEKRSARILAILLALIMLGSVFAYIWGGGTREKRETKLSFSTLEAAVYAPENSFIYYYNLAEYSKLSKKLGKNDSMISYFEGYFERDLSHASRYYLDRRVIEFTHPINEMLVAQYGDYNVYFINENSSKVYFAKQGERKVGNLSVKVSGSIAMVDEVNPLIIGYNPLVLEVLNNFEENRTAYRDFISRLNGTYLFSIMIFGNETGKYVRFSENESPIEFFFEGYRYNESAERYEKVWGIQFTENYFFSDMNETERGFEYYYFQNFEDGFSLAVMGDKNFTRVLNARANVIGIIIRT